MSVISITKLYELLSSKLGKETAENLTTFIEHKIKNEVEGNTQTLATKEELLKMKSELEAKISETKVDLIKWMFAFWVTLVLMIVGIYFKK